MARTPHRPRDERGRFLSHRQVAARKGVATRERNRVQVQVIHGQRARERTEKRLTPAQKAARTRAANKLEKEIARERKNARARDRYRARKVGQPRSERGGGGGGEDYDSGGSGGGGGGGGSVIHSLDELDDFSFDDPGDYYEIETSPDYEEA